ncbi:Os12g0176100, partial [Oryza sativa Japonica Group]
MWKTGFLTGALGLVPTMTALAPRPNSDAATRVSRWASSGATGAMRKTFAQATSTRAPWVLSAMSLARRSSRACRGWRAGRRPRSAASRLSAPGVWAPALVEMTRWVMSAAGWSHSAIALAAVTMASSGMTSWAKLSRTSSDGAARLRSSRWPAIVSSVW